MHSFSRKILITILVVASLITTVHAYESNVLISIIDADYPETVEVGGVLDLEVTVSYNFTQDATLNVWVLDGPWWGYDSEVVADVYVDVSEPGPEVISLQVPVPDEAGEYVFEADSGWCELDSTELLPGLNGYQRYNITFTVTPSGTSSSGGSETTTGVDTTDTGETGGIPGFPVTSVIFGLVLVSVAVNLTGSRE